MTPKEIRDRMRAIAKRAEAYLPDLNSSDEAKVKEAREKHDKAMVEFDSVQRQLEASEKVASREAQATGDLQFESLADNAMPDYVSSILNRGNLQGRAAEINAELSDLGVTPQSGGVVVPWAVLERAARGPQQRAVTGTAQLPAAQNQRPIVGRVFAPSLIDFFGAEPVQVPQGTTELPIITGAGSVVEQLAEGAAPGADPSAAAFTTHALKPKRLTGEAEMSVEGMAQVPGLEQAIAADTLAAIQDTVSGVLLTGDGVGANLAGFYSRVAEPANDPADMVALAAIVRWPGGSVDGIYAQSEEDVAILVGTQTYQTMTGIFFTNSDNINTVRWIRNERASLRVSAKVPNGAGGGNAAAQAKRQSVIIRRGQRPNQSFFATWSAGPEIVRDPYSKADAGTLRLVWHLLHDGLVATRPAEWRRLTVQHTA